MTRSRNALLGTMFVLGSCILFIGRLPSDDGGGINPANPGVRPLVQRGMMSKRAPLLRVRLRAKGFGFQPGLEIGYGIRSITLRELCQLLECSSQDFRTPKAFDFYQRLAYKNGERPLSFTSQYDRYIHRPGKYSCAIWFHDRKHLPVNIEDAKVQAAVTILSDSE